jgi:hypothetical protein
MSRHRRAAGIGKQDLSVTAHRIQAYRWSVPLFGAARWREYPLARQGFEM